MTSAPRSESIHLAIVGLVNSGKSSLMNAIFGRPVAIVSDHPGTTTDPVTKSIELAGAGPCVVTDTAGLDDASLLGAERVKHSLERLATCDVLVLATRGDLPLTAEEKELAASFAASGRKLVVAVTFSDRCAASPSMEAEAPVDETKAAWLGGFAHALVNNLSGTGVEALKQLLIDAAATSVAEISPLEGLVKEGDHILLVAPIDLAAPKGRLILPQVETLRDALDRDCAATIVKERELAETYAGFAERPSLVVTDSQAFSKTAADIAPDQRLTSFSILFARKKGDLAQFVRGTRVLDRLGPAAKALIVESCSHHQQPDDIGTVKIPRLLRQIVRADMEIDFAHGVDLDKDYSGYAVAIFCGGCMRTRREMLRMTAQLESQGVAVTNYGLFLAWANGLLPRALEPFPHEYQLYVAG